MKDLYELAIVGDIEDTFGEIAGPGAWLVNDAGQAITRFNWITGAMAARELPGDHVVIIEEAE